MSQTSRSILRRTLRGSAAATLFAATMGAGAQSARAPAEDIVAAFKRIDTDADGKVSRAETARLAAIAGRFDQLDRDRDGYLTLAEFAAAFDTAQ
jgi:Ca2+-binding EF-hand superfamily protein